MLCTSQGIPPGTEIILIAIYLIHKQVLIISKLIYFSNTHLLEAFCLVLVGELGVLDDVVEQTLYCLLRAAEALVLVLSKSHLFTISQG